jgi:hypothetical protein
MKRRFLGAVGSSLVWLSIWAGCSTVDRPAGHADDAGSGGDSEITASTAGKGSGGSAGNGSAGGSASGSGSTTAGSSSVAGTAVGGQGDNGGGGTSTTPVGECAADETEACGDCGVRTCDSTTLKWGPCTGDGKQEDCWKTEAGVALPGTIPAQPKGSCHAGKQTCQADGKWAACTGAVAPAATDDCNVAGNDANCDGNPNGGCNCVSGEMRACGSATGNCKKGTQTCTNLIWGDCVGEVKAAATDSCAVTGDDGNCNGVPNEGCACNPGNAATVCNDSVACTDDGCNNGVCVHGVSAGSCLIGGSCIANNTKESGNPCHYCDASANKTGWSNSSASTSCDDGKWCNGDDSCDGGSCQHQFTGNRCTATGDCALSVCDETRDSCFKPTTASCDATTEKQCTSSTACGAHVQSRTVTQFCSGTSVDCNGKTMAGSWANSSDCSASQKCNASSNSCVAALGCGTSWCNAGTCWTLNNDLKNLADAKAYCAGLTLDGATWKLATILEYLSVDQGCDGTGSSGMSTTGASTCTLPDVLNGGTTDCSPCTEGGSQTGADAGCYFMAGMGSCNLTSQGYWSSSRANPGALGFDPKDNTVFWYPIENEALPYRCTTAGP